VFPITHNRVSLRAVKLLIPLFLVASACLAQATPAAAERARKAYQLGIERWILETRLAKSPEEHAAAARNRPDPAQAARDVWNAISPELNRDWILPHAAWFIQMVDGIGTTASADSGGQPPFHTEMTALLGAIRTHHTSSDGLAPVAIALAHRGGPERLNILEKIREQNPDKSIRGVAALAQSIAMKSLGDEPGMIAKRLQLIREAIIHSADVILEGDMSVASVAEEELYVILNLTRGRTAPDLSGTDSAGRAIKLSDHAGKVVVVVFWSAGDPNAREIIEFFNAMQGRMRGRPMEILGVNIDDTAVLRPIEADGTITWRNISDPGARVAHEFRITSTPICFVLDKERVIHHIGSPGSFIELTAMALLEEEQE